MADVGLLTDELWDWLIKGFEILFILIVTFYVAKIVNKILDKSFKKSSALLKVDADQYKFLRHLLSSIIYTFGIAVAIYVIPELRSLSVSILAGAGILAVVIGFASQAPFSNIVSGIFIAIFKPFAVGDRVKVGADKR